MPGLSLRYSLSWDEAEKAYINGNIILFETQKMMIHAGKLAQNLRTLFAMQVFG